MSDDAIRETDHELREPRNRNSRFHERSSNLRENESQHENNHSDRHGNENRGIDHCSADSRLELDILEERRLQLSEDFRETTSLLPDLYERYDDGIEIPLVELQGLGYSESMVEILPNLTDDSAEFKILRLLLDDSKCRFYVDTAFEKVRELIDELPYFPFADSREDDRATTLSSHSRLPLPS